MRLLPLLAVATVLAMAGPVLAQAIKALPFDKQLTLATVGDVDAQFEVGLAYETGAGVIPDEAEAAKWFRQAALQGNVEAQFHLARLVARGAKGLKQGFVNARNKGNGSTRDTGYNIGSAHGNAFEV